MKILICANGYTKKQIIEANAVQKTLNKLGHNSFINENLDDDKKLSNCDLIVSLGGDGALLKAGQYALKYDKPLLGINSGRLGYLCAMKLDEIKDFNKILKKCVCEKRSVLNYRFDDKKGLAINDLSVGKENFGQTADLLLIVNDKQIGQIRGDGIIVSTPTGSSAYNVSAGGPLLDVDAKILSITPVCSHNHDLSPYVIADNKKVVIKVNHDKAGIYVDGEFIGKTNKEVVVKKDKRVLKIYTNMN